MNIVPSFLKRETNERIRLLIYEENVMQAYYFEKKVFLFSFYRGKRE